MVVCEAGEYSLRTGAGPLGNDPGCGSSHCELLTQDNLATLVVVSLHFCKCPFLPVAPSLLFFLLCRFSLSLNFCQGEGYDCSSLSIGLACAVRIRRVGNRIMLRVAPIVAYLFISC